MWNWENTRGSSVPPTTQEAAAILRKRQSAEVRHTTVDIPARGQKPAVLRFSAVFRVRGTAVHGSAQSGNPRSTVPHGPATHGPGKRSLPVPFVLVESGGECILLGAGGARGDGTTQCSPFFLLKNLSFFKTFLSFLHLSFFLTPSFLFYTFLSFLHLSFFFSLVVCRALRARLAGW